MDVSDYKERFRRLVPFNRLREGQQDKVFATVEPVQLDLGQELFRQGSQDAYTYYLMDGSLSLFVDGVRAKQVASDSDAAKSPLGHLQPRRLTAIAESPIVVLRIRSALVERVLAPRTDDDGADGFNTETTEAMNPGWLAAALKPELFAKLPPANMQRLFAAMEWVKFKAGDNVIRQGDLGDYYYIIKEGSCEVRRTTSVSAHGIKLAELKPGDAFGEDALISNMRRNATVRMITDGELIRIGRDDFSQLIKQPLLKTVPFESASMMVREGAVWLDVRFPEESRNGALPGSMNIPLNMLRMYAAKLDTGKSYVAYCDDGTRSSVAAFILRERGFECVCVEGGCGAQLSALYAIHVPGGNNPDLTETIIPRSPVGETYQNTVPMEEETLKILDHLASLQLFATGDRPHVVDNPLTPLVTDSASEEATRIAMPILAGSDRYVDPLLVEERPERTSEQFPPGKGPRDEPTLVERVEQAVGGGRTAPAHSDPRMRDLEAQLSYERNTAETLRKELAEARNRIASASADQIEQAVANERIRLEQLHEGQLEQIQAQLQQSEAQLIAERTVAEQLRQSLTEVEQRRLATADPDADSDGAPLAEIDREGLRQQLDSLQSQLTDSNEQRLEAQVEIDGLRAALRAAEARLEEVQGLQHDPTDSLEAAVATERARLEQHYREQIERMQNRLNENVVLLERSSEQLRHYETAMQQGSAVSAERDQLEQSYRQRIEELERLMSAQAEAEELLNSERQKLTGELAEKRRLLEEAQRRLKETPGQAQQLHEATEAQLSELRKILGAEFARNAALVELAKQERASAETARKRLVEQTEEVFAEYRGRHERLRAQEEERVREERRLMEMERGYLRAAMEASNRSREHAEQMIRNAEEQAQRLRSLAGTQLESIESDARADMRRVQTLLGPTVGRDDGTRSDSFGELENRVGQEIRHQVEDMLSAKAPLATSAKILDMQRQDMERIQKRTEEVKVAQHVGMEVIRGGLAGKESSTEE